jgi:transposase
MARRAKEILVTEGDYQKLLVMGRSLKLEKRYSDRARIILLSLEKKTLDEIVEEVGLSRKVVNGWRNRFREKGLEGLKDEPRSGKPATITAEQKALVIQKACEKPGEGYTNWSHERIGRSVGISRSRVQQILKQADLKPHKTEYWCGKSNDPEFESKMVNIVGLYLNPPENAIVFCVDEKTQMQALDRTQPELPMKSGLPKRQTATYKRHGTVSLIAALAVHSGEIIGKTMKSNNADNFLKFLKKLDRTHRHKTLHVIVDNLSVHKDKTVKAWIAGKRKIKLHFTPTYSSWLNQIEIWFNILSKDVLKDAIWKSTEQMSDQIIEYIKTYNKTRAKPFNWTYTGNPLVY